MHTFKHIAASWPIHRPSSWLSAILICVASHLPAQADTADVTYTLGSSAGTVKALLGVNAGPLHWGTGTADVVGGFKQIGVSQVRTHDFPGAVDMSVMYPDRSKDPTLQSSYNFTSAKVAEFSGDTAIATLKDNGIGVYLRIWDSAGNVSAPTASERANWTQAAVQVIRHYQEGQWNGYSGLINSVEIGNEPDSNNFWPGYTKEEFYKLYVDTAKAIRAAFPSMKIGGPGVTQGGFNGNVGQNWTRSFLDYVKSNGAPLDFFSWHIYTNTPTDYATGAKFYRSELDKRGFTSTETHLTEWNTSIGATGDPTTAADYDAIRTKGKGAALMTASWINLQQQSVSQTFFYRANDPSSTDLQRYGLFSTDGLPRKTALAFSLWSEFAAYSDRIDPIASGSGATLTTLAAQRADGQIAVLVANTGTASSKWAVTFADSRKLGDYAVSLKTVDDSSPMVTASAPTGAVYTIAANTVQLLTLHSKTQKVAFSATAFGNSNKLLVSANFLSNAADIGKTQTIYLAALLGNSLYFNNGSVWKAWTGGDIPAYANSALPAQLIIPIFMMGSDARALNGTQLFLGYGSSVTEMLAAGRYKRIYTFGP